ncbi:MAG TPA: tetratricopeptide repeat protein, partial [Pyrinomonadaceae bacterium]|nr:tetratricopeptide repeat protein [Pyrinomonadaceae bacterium]
QSPITQTLKPSHQPIDSYRRFLFPILAVFVILLFSGFVYWNFASKKIESPNQIKTLAILPFKPLSISEQDAILGVGMADTIISKLTSIKRITIRPTSAIAKYASQTKELKVIGNELEVDALLDGNIQRTGDKLRVSVQLIRVSDGSPLWASTFDTRESDIFALQDSISSQVADSLALKLNDEERQQINKHSTQNPEAYKLYLNGIFQLNKRTLESAKRAILYFEEAIEKQPDYALAYSGLGDAYIMLGNQEALLGGQSPRENIPKAKSALNKALNLDSSLAEANASMAWISIWEDGNDTRAIQNLNRAIELNPNSVNARHYLALLYMIRGEFDSALVEMRKAQQVDQFSLVINVNIATILLRQKSYQEAEAQCLKNLELDPNFPRVHWVYGLVLEQIGKYNEAISEFQKAVELSNGGTLAKASLAHAYAKKGNPAEAEKILAELIAKSNENYIAPDSIAAVYTALGDKEKAFSYLEKGVRERQFSMFQLEIEQHFDEIRSDARFKKIQSQMQNKPIE